MLELLHYNPQDMFVGYYATSLLCDKNRGPTRAAGGGDASARTLSEGRGHGVHVHRKADRSEARVKDALGAVSMREAGRIGRGRR